MPANTIVYPKALPWLAAGVVLLCAGLLIGLWYEPYPELEEAIFSENGPVEAPEMIALAAAMVVFAYRAFRTDDPTGGICAGIAMLLAIALVRETSRCNSAFYEGGICFPGHFWKNSTYALLVAAGGTALFLRRRHARAALSVPVLNSLWPLWVAAVLLASAEIAEEFGLMGAEETLELFSYLYLAAFGIWLNRNS